jgi:hypothetical protein
LLEEQEEEEQEEEQQQRDNTLQIQLFPQDFFIQDFDVFLYLETKFYNVFIPHVYLFAFISISVYDTSFTFILHLALTYC